MCVYMSVCLCAPAHMHAGVRPEKAIRFPGSGVPGNCGYLGLNFVPLKEQQTLLIMRPLHICVGPETLAH